MVSLDEKTLAMIRDGAAVMSTVHSESPEAVARITAFREELAKDLRNVHTGRLKGRYYVELYEKVSKLLGEKAKEVFDHDDRSVLRAALETLGYPCEATFDPAWIARAVDVAGRVCPDLKPEEREKIRKQAQAMWDKYMQSKSSQELLIRYPHMIASYLMVCAYGDVVKARTQWVSKYKNHCWHCFAPVSAAFNPKCDACGWSICICGSCTSHGTESFWKHKGPPCPQPLKNWFQQHVAAPEKQPLSA